jgi:hopanoid C-3 methylase HpnR
MKALFVHPAPLLYTKVFLRLEPLGLELVAEAARRAGHDVRLIDLQVEDPDDYHRLITQWRPDFIAFSCNYLANVPEIIDLAKETKAVLPRSFICVGGHSASFTARAIIDHGEGAINCCSRARARRAADGEGPPPRFVHHLDDLAPARDLLRHRRKYFIGILDPAASIEFSRGCPWDCSFCSAWTFYGRSYRLVSPERVVEDLETIREPGVFIVDDVAFVHAKHGFAIGEAIARKGIRKKYYLETRGDVLLRNKEVFQFWKSIGLEYMFLGIEAIDEEGLRKFRKRVSVSKNLEALEFARSLGIEVAINIIADPDWDEERFATIREWCMEVPEIVNISINTPYPGTESWLTEERRLWTRDYRLFDIQHAVLPAKLPLPVFYRELLKTQRVLFLKHFNWRSALLAGGEALRLFMRGQTNFVRGMMLYKKTYNLDKMLSDHARPVRYEIPLPPHREARVTTAHANSSATKPVAEPLAKSANLYIHAPRGPAARHIDDSTEQFVDATRMRVAQ